MRFGEDDWAPGEGPGALWDEPPPGVDRELIRRMMQAATGDNLDDPMSLIVTAERLISLERAMLASWLRSRGLRVEAEEILEGHHHDSRLAEIARRRTAGLP